MRLGANELRGLANTLEGLKEHRRNTVQKRDWPSVAMRAPTVLDEDALRQFVVMRLFAQLDDGGVHSIVPQSANVYGINLAHLVHADFSCKMIRSNAQELVNQLVWRHPPVHYEPRPAPKVPEKPYIPAMSAAVFVCPKEPAEQVYGILEQYGTVLWRGDWSADVRRDVPGMCIVRWTPH
jgi:hypothetical protein